MGMQDFFELGLIPADTDFRIFADANDGQTPGIDIASLLDSSAYHMWADVTERIKPGTLQARHWLVKTPGVRTAVTPGRHHVLLVTMCVGCG